MIPRSITHQKKTAIYLQFIRELEFLIPYHGKGQKRLYVDGYKSCCFFFLILIFNDVLVSSTHFQ